MKFREFSIQLETPQNTATTALLSVSLWWSFQGRTKTHATPIMLLWSWSKTTAQWWIIIVWVMKFRRSLIFPGDYGPVTVRVRSVLPACRPGEYRHLPEPHNHQHEIRRHPMTVALLLCPQRHQMTITTTIFLFKTAGSPPFNRLLLFKVKYLKLSRQWRGTRAGPPNQNRTIVYYL